LNPLSFEGEGSYNSLCISLESNNSSPLCSTSLKSKGREKYLF